MKSFNQIRNYIFRITLSLLVLPCNHRLLAQCNNWNINAQLVSSSTCAANGNIQVLLSGTDVGNLSNIQYGIPIAGNGFSVPLNNSNNFYSVPPGTYQISAVAQCNGSLVGKNTTITIPGSYYVPTMQASVIRNSISCGAYGLIYCEFSNGRPPYTVNITNAPSTYPGPLSFTTSNSSVSLPRLSAGSYTVQLVDACGSGTSPQTLTISNLSFSSLQFTNPTDFTSYSCDTALILKPGILYNTPWSPYGNDTLFKVSVQIAGNLFLPSADEYLNSGSFKLKLTSGYTIKDCYGKTLTYTIKPPCGNSITQTTTFPYPSVTTNADQHCNSGFDALITFEGALCFPLTYSVLDPGTNTTFGPYTTSTLTTSVPSLPLGNYTLSFTTSDGYSGTGSLGATPIVGNPYSVTAVNTGSGLHQYIESFSFSTSISFGNKTVELFNGPAGYSFNGTWPGSNFFFVSDNQTPGTNHLKFPARNYVWKITDDCGVYYLPITVGAPDLYQFAIAIDSQKQTCQGLKVWPSVQAMHNGVSVPAKFSVLRNGSPLLSTTTFLWPQFSAGSFFLIDQPGTYTFVPSVAATTINLSSIGYPNPYTVSTSLTYTQYALTVDMNHTQGFLCIGGTNGQAQIFAAGSGGIPYSNPSHYQYSLAAQGQGVSGPYLQSNITGIFSGFGGNANSIYDVKVADSCGAFAVQSIKILDLQTSRLINSTDYVACEGEEVQLVAAYFPNATYSWTGPGGFSSTSQQPVITNINSQKEGVYYVTIATPQCSLPVTDSTIVTMAPNPSKPTLSVSCVPFPPTITINNPTPAFQYLWNNEIFFGTNSYQYTQPVVPPGYTDSIFFIGIYSAVVIDTGTGCKSQSDSVVFGVNPSLPVAASIYSPHLSICAGDTTILIASGLSGSLTTYQWFYDGAVIPGATSGSYVTAQPGNYKVFMDAGICSKDTSDEVTVTVIANPAVTISVSSSDICAGDSALVTASFDTNYSYTWYYNGATVPSANSSSLAATQTGTYSVTVSNGGCVATSAPVTVTAHVRPDPQLVPSSPQHICPGSVVNFSTTFNAAYSYTWQMDGAVIPNATGNTLQAATPGNYYVTISAPYCPDSTAGPVSVSILPTNIDLGPDTIICAHAPFSLPLSLDSGYTQIMWSDGSTGNSVNASYGGVWWVSAMNSCGNFSDTFKIVTWRDFLPNLPEDTVVCNESQQLTLGLPEGLSDIRWSSGDTTPSIVIKSPGTYWVEAVSPCDTVRDTINIHFCPPVIRDIVLSEDSICEGSCLQISSVTEQYPSTYLWTFDGARPGTSTAAQPGTICYDNAGKYQVKLVVSNAGGADTFTREIVVTPSPQPRFEDTSVTVKYKTSVSLPACDNAWVMDWYLGDSLICQQCSFLQFEAKNWKTEYRCVVRNADCSDTCKYHVEVTDIPSDIWLPSAFSPNQDGKNDGFRVITDNPNVNIVDLSVYNRWGQRLFWSNDRNGWDGNYSGGRPADNGVYFWMVRYKIAGNTELFIKQGDVTLIR